jgi:uncharacterized protein (TIGR00297 family)
MPNLSLADPWLVAIVLNTTLAIVGLLLPKKPLTNWGLVHGWFLGVLLWGCLGWQGFLVMFSYLVLGTGVTYIGKDIKEAKGIAEKRSGARGPENLWGSAVIGVLCALGYTFYPHPWWLLGYVASISTKLSDTCASEIGKAYGKSTFLITNFQPVPPGTEGAISLEGTTAGIVGSLLMAGVGWGVNFIHDWEVAICALSALVATTLESLIGATLQNKYAWLTNEVVNGINTAIGAGVAVSLAWLFK